MSTPTTFALDGVHTMRLWARAPVIRESRIIRDLTMPERDWEIYDSPARDRAQQKRKQE